VFALEDILKIPPFSLGHSEKSRLYVDALRDLTGHHREHSPEYRRIVDMLGFDAGKAGRVEDFPFIPVRLFKEFELRSVEKAAVVKTLTSSGTTGQAVSRIFLDRDAAAGQMKVLVKIASAFTGGKRLPFLVVDSSAVISDRNLFSARGAGVLGFSTLGRDITYLLDENYEIDFARLEAFQERHRGEKVMMFGFTFVVWERLCQALKKAGRKLDLDGILIHGGGWKKLISMSVDNPTFRQTVKETTGIAQVYNYYGMVEQTGSIFMECEEGHLHASIFSDILIRDPKDFAPLSPGKSGIVQLISLLPRSYPGHSILSEDLGEIVGIDDCPCGRLGKYFHIHGRLKSAEIRGCSDVYAPAA
jgi:phenylacetate-coenzyme A ligase PaaK-like adenylate-forming protein